MSQIFTIQNDKIIIDSLVLTNTEGSVTHAGDLTVSGTLTVDNLIVNNQETSTKEVSTNWAVNTENELAGKGFTWTWGSGSVGLAYRNGKRLCLTGGNLDLEASGSYRIDNTEVVTLNSLGPTVTKSNLKELGNLKSLSVLGDATLSEFAYFNSGFGRLGLNTDEPNGALSILENDVEIVLGSPKYGCAQIGTHTTHDLALITDNTDRIIIKNNGKIVFGNAATKTADVTIYGTLNVETLVADNRIERFSSLEIKSSKDSSIYGKGIIWTGEGDPRQFIMLAGSDRLWSSESIDLGKNRSYFINRQAVLSENALGEGIINSKLATVGHLEELTVKGETNLLHTLAVRGAITTPDLTISKNGSSITVSGSRINTETAVAISVFEDDAFYADINEVSIGNKNNSRRPVKLFGPVSVGIANPDLDADFTVKGSIKFSDKKFITGVAQPTEGTFNKGDICWNSEPQLHGYIGWVCVNSGAPGVWVPFGAIGR